MALRRLPLELESTAIPRRVAALLEAAEREVECFMDRRWHRPVPGFYPSDHRMVYHALLAMQCRHGLAARLFCEWGSGFAVAAGLAALLGCRAYGIETDRELVEAARGLATRFDVPVRIFQGSFVPAAARCLPLLADCLAWLDTTTPSAYGKIGLDPSDFGVIYAYPWPGEEQAVFELFDEYAAPGALLLTFHGAEDLRLHEKSVPRRRPRRRRR